MADQEIGSNPMPEGDGADLSLLDLLVILAKHRNLVLGLPVASVIVAVVVVFLIPVQFTATAKIMPPQQSQSNAVAILGQLGAVGGFAQTALGFKNPSEIFVTMLKSRTVADSIIQRFELLKVYDKDYIEDARKKLMKRVYIASARDGAIVVEVDDNEPERAAAMANAYIEELERLTLHLAISEAAQRRLFFEKQVSAAKSNLAKAEDEMRRFKETSGLVSPEGQAQLSVAASASIRAQITVKEVQLSAIRSFATEQNPELVRAEKELAGLRAQLARMEKNASEGRGDVLVSLGSTAGNSLEYLQRFRDLRYQEILFELMSRQYELAKVDEAKNATLVQVIDPAIVPERKSWPPRAVIISLTALAALILGIILALLREAGEKLRSDPAKMEKVGRLRAYLFRR